MGIGPPGGRDHPEGTRAGRRSGMADIRCPRCRGICPLGQPCLRHGVPEDGVGGAQRADSPHAGTGPAQLGVRCLYGPRGRDQRVDLCTVRALRHGGVRTGRPGARGAGDCGVARRAGRRRLLHGFRASGHSTDRPTSPQQRRPSGAGDASVRDLSHVSQSVR
ncbi:hypothetical protein G6F35_016189 [Rhizopus arrhizus]|nr:hypothetical protein G6F35_016189 [Rhizopus arrhizus]